MGSLVTVYDAVYTVPSLRVERETSEETIANFWTWIVVRDELSTMVIHSKVIHKVAKTRGSQLNKSVRDLSLDRGEVEAKLEQPQALGGVVMVKIDPQLVENYQRYSSCQSLRLI